MKFFKRNEPRNEWRTVAIHTGFIWWFHADPNTTFTHVVLYQVCDITNERRFEYDDATEEGRDYARSGNKSVARARSLWVHAGKIKNSDNIVWVDESYSPYGDLEELISAFDHNPKLETILEENYQVKTAWNDFVASVKLTRNI